MDFGNGFEENFPLGSLRNSFKYPSIGYLSCVTQFMVSTSFTVLAVPSSVLKIISSLLFLFLPLNCDFYLLFSPQISLSLGNWTAVICAVFPFYLCDSAKIVRKLRDWRKNMPSYILSNLSMCHPVWFCQIRLRFSYILVKSGNIMFFLCHL